MTPDPDTWFRAGQGSCAGALKIGLSHFTSRCCCPLPWPTVIETTAPLLASVCSGESAAPHNPQPWPTLNLFLYFSAEGLPQSTSLLLRCCSLFFLLSLPVRLLIFLLFHCVFLLCSIFFPVHPLSVFQSIPSLAAFTPLLLTLP